MSPLVAVDVQYDDDLDLACVAAVWFHDWERDAAAGHRLHFVEGLAPYVPGSFYQRELPCLLPLVSALIAELSPRAIVVDAHVDLDEGRPGLGRHLHHAILQEVEVIGVAKRPFHGGVGIPVVRGASRQPLWITATGDPAAAAAGVARMAGPHRVPALLKEVDRRARVGLGTGPASR